MSSQRTRPVLSRSSPPVPHLQINGESADFIHSYNFSSSTSSARSQSTASTPNHGLSPINREYTSPSPYNDCLLIGMTSQYSSNEVTRHERDGSNLSLDLLDISPTGPIHNQRNSSPAASSYCSTAVTSFDNPTVNFNDSDWLPGPLPLRDLRNSRHTFTTESEASPVPNHDCSECQLKDHHLAQLESHVQGMTQRIREYEQLVKDQHRVLTSQQSQILELAQNQSRKRRHLQDEHDVSASGGLPIQAHTTAAPNKRGRFLPKQRKQTAETRQKGACVKCWKHKVRCEPGEDEEDPCKACRDLSLTLIRIPCVRTHIIDLDIFRLGTGENDTWTQRGDVGKVMDLTTYTSDDQKYLSLTHGFGPTLSVSVKLFRPVRNDVTEYVWRDGQGILRKKDMPPYALSNIDELILNINTYVKENQNAYINHFVREVDTPTWEAFRIGRKLAASGKSPLLQETLELWTAARLIEKPWQICGEETLGLENDDHWWWIPVTPIMDTQLDQIVMKRCLIPWRKNVLQRLQTKIEKDCRTNWLEIFVTIIILLNTIEEATRHDHEFATFFGHEYAPGRRRFEDYKLIESYFHSARTLLTHVKVALDGRIPFLDAETDVTKLMQACTDDDEKDYMIETDKYISDRKKKSDFVKVRERHQYETHQFWVHQLFLKEWDGRQIEIQEI